MNLKSICWCRVVAAALIIVLTWWMPGWANWAITILAVIILLISLSGKCCCKETCERKMDAPTDPQQPQQPSQ